MSKKNKINKRMNDDLAISVSNENTRRRDVSSVYNSYYYRTSRITYEELNAIYQQSPIARRAVDLICNYVLKKGFVVNISEDKNGKLQDELMKLYDRIGMEKLLIKAFKNALINGHTVMVIKDAISNPKEQLDLTTLKGRKPCFVVVDPRYTTTVPDSDPLSPNYNKPIKYAVAGTILDKSFVIEFDGLEVTDYLKPMYKYMGMSIYQPAFVTLVNDDIISKAIPNIVWRSSVPHYKITGFKDAISQGTESQILKFIGTTENEKNILGASVSDAEDDVSILTRDISGLDAIDQRSIYRLSAAFGIPAVILLGKSPDGQNSTGKADFEAFYNFIEEWQQHWKAAVHKLVKVLLAYITGRADIDFEVVFNKVNMQSPQEKSENDSRVLDNVAKMEQLNLPSTAVTRYLNENSIITEEEIEEIKTLDEQEMNAGMSEKELFGEDEQEEAPEDKKGLLSKLLDR